ncbi:MAG: bifunctional riboflavin kinase/FAD synthetase, partial [Kiritimatiellae bacterium]|nr:bifunctional riboflavin kinase/FAD synthetase [Kiritimatiellia bacterium]
MREADVSVLAVGFFDGVHLGHQAILRGAGAALTFRSHPLSVLAPGRAPKLIMGLEERLAAIGECGVKDVVALDFTPELADMEPADFLRLAAERHPFASLRCGANWRFGRGGAGDAAWLRARGVPVEVAPFAL